MAVVLRDLLTQSEIDSTIEVYMYLTDINVLVKNMTIADLSKIALLLIGTEYGDSTPICSLPAKALEILTDRSIERNLPIFTQ